MTNTLDTRARAHVFLTPLFWIQGLYFTGTGIWPLVSIETFQMVTGAKTDHLVTGLENDHWLVMTVGVLIIAIGLPLLVAAWRRTCPGELVLLAMGSSIGLTLIDVVYVVRETIPPIYLADAGLEILLLLAWVGALTKARGE